ncbi:MAG TPA: hypothetical protein VMD47_08235 [Candidatus Acidoferrales bacterium]|nr:hypothetical protein [Candidatus Acidoferrales bacterium]
MLFPPAAAVTVAIDGRPVLAYHAAYLRAGHVYAPLRPFITRVAFRLWYEGDTLVISRGGHQARLRLDPRQPGALDDVYVPAARVLRALGAQVSYGSRRLDVRIGYVPIATPTPFNASLPSAPPQAVFTPPPAVTPRPVWTGTPLPRRTPLPVIAPTPQDRGLPICSQCRRGSPPPRHR